MTNMATSNAMARAVVAAIETSFPSAFALLSLGTGISPKLLKMGCTRYEWERGLFLAIGHAR
jgi:hypothetical protein